MAGNCDAAAPDGNNPPRRPRIKILPRGSRSSSNGSGALTPVAADSKPAEEANKTSAVSAPVKDINMNGGDNPLTVSPASTNSAPASCGNKLPHNPFPNSGSDNNNNNIEKKPTTAAQTKTIKVVVKNKTTKAEQTKVTKAEQTKPIKVVRNNTTKAEETKITKAEHIKTAKPAQTRAAKAAQNQSTMAEEKKPVQRRTSDESLGSNSSGVTMPAHFPPCPSINPDYQGLLLWRQGCEAVQRPDGTVEGLDVANWLMTRRGGVVNPWPMLEQNRASVRTMRRERFDLEKFQRQQQEEAEIARLKEERRQANKRRYRPRGQIAKEKAERAAAAAAAAAEKANEEAQQQTQEQTEKEVSTGSKRSLTEETEIDNDQPQAKKAKLDALV